jgi:DNA-directed RNA polymerase subunit RPC12/RpoP
MELLLIMFMSRIEVICRRCGRKAPVDEFRVDHVYKLAVCRVCYTEREKNLPKKKKEEPTLNDLMLRNASDEKNVSAKEDRFQIKRSKLFDDDDEYLEKAIKKKEERIRLERENSIRVKKISADKVLYPCQNCNYKFKYNIVTRRPLVCPYCEKKISPNIVF